jgi:hypothetical protein
MWRLAVLLSLLTLLAGCGSGVFFISHGDNVDRRTPLEKAAQEGNLAEVSGLLAAGADPNGPAGVFHCPLNAAAGRSDNVEVIRVLLAAGANPNGRAMDNAPCWPSPLAYAAGTGDVENTRALLDAGASIQSNRCPLLPVVWLKPPIVDLLVERGLDLNRVDEAGRNELHIALAPPMVPQSEAVQRLLQAGVPLSARDNSGKTPLDYWREPHECDQFRLSTWLFERFGDSYFRTQRENRAKISALLGVASLGPVPMALADDLTSATSNLGKPSTPQTSTESIYRLSSRDSVSRW